MAQGNKTTVGYAALAAALASTAPAYAQVVETSKPIEMAAGNLDPFAGNIDPFAGNIDPFGGNLDPFGGNLDPFGGNLDPFGGNIDPFGGNIDPFAGRTDFTSAGLGAHWKSFGTEWQEVKKRWDAVDSAPTDAAAATALVTQLQLVANKSEEFWGAAVKKKSGKTAKSAVIDPLLAKYGVSLSDPSSFKKLTKSQRSKLVFEWYDTLQANAGIDQVDRWMGLVNWNPNLTKVQGGGSDSVIGMLDSKIGADVDLRDNIVRSTGYKSSGNQHGAGVLSLMISEHDNQGLQGIAPKAKVYVHNPFDSTGTASWADVTKGINKLLDSRASIVNLSLGVKGSTLHQDWKTVFSNAYIAPRSNKAIYVLSAGNDGITQTTNVDWLATNAPSLILVGSVDARGTISSFSNRPGSACMTVAGVCGTGNLLADRFMVAPGELNLVSDGNNGSHRVTGTSFAAPLVSGAIALLHDRWPWLVNHPDVSANIILSTARDLGEKGTDAVYGRGLLDVEASQSPLDFKNLRYYEYTGTSAVPVERTISYVTAQVAAKNWSADGVFYSAYETLGAMQRDFLIPMSTRLIGQKTSVNGSSEYFQAYVTDRLDDMVNEGLGFSDARQLTVPTRSGLKIGFNILPAKVNGLERSAISRLPTPNLRLSTENGRFGFSMGQGNGLRILGEAKGFGVSSDYDASNGGVNPVLGFASGGSFVNTDVALDEKTSLAIGFTENRVATKNNVALSETQRTQLRDLDDYRANAFNVRVAHKLGAGATLNVDYARVREGNGLLGVQSTEKSDLRSGTASQTATVGASFKMPAGLMLAASATGAVTKSASRDQALTTTGKGVLSSAFAVAMTKQGLFSSKDGLRLSVSQPLNVESGKLAFSSVEVTDRTTGERGRTTQTFDISNKSRRLTGELMYATPLLKSGELSLFGRADYRLNVSDGKKVDGLVIGGRVSLPF